jgi:hypothetical protein
VVKAIYAEDQLVDILFGSAVDICTSIGNMLLSKPTMSFFSIQILIAFLIGQIPEPVMREP